jgi:hypothetical protein
LLKKAHPLKEFSNGAPLHISDEVSVMGSRIYSRFEHIRII